MPKVKFRIAGSDDLVVDGAVGSSIMQVAVRADVPGIIGECGGDLSCATCHVYVKDQSPFKRRTEDEEDLLELADNVCDNSRLSCQLALTDAVDLVEVEVPAG
ncbi:2Fe-2S iron-sulfur cluster-binding protein [Georgenia sp. AZ-5]|uniref:2Fe-2S iron-sulfur cluster-binding protein n=1 Tax=Georgenia sp. AZ-5 TaxID=3367526 RepID=UPI003753FBD3